MIYRARQRLECKRFVKEVGGVGPTVFVRNKGQSDWLYGHRYSQSDDDPLKDLPVFPVCCQLSPFGFLTASDHAGQPVGQYAHDISYHT